MAQPPPRAALTAKKYRADECALAIRGQAVPQSLGLPVTRLCVVRGIRYNPGFGSELYGTCGEFTRALNARRIMSNDIPQIDHPDHFPYCVWYPETATEATYKELARRYPNMVYQVGRACAVAGYTDLYRELKLLPEVHIAEEARDNGSTDIYDAIMVCGTKYAVMNDYTRSVDMDNPRPAHLNGDTAVRSLLEIKQKHEKPVAKFDSEGYKKLYFNITEDMNISDHDTPAPIPEDITPLLYTPLPPDLPAIHKDLLILLSAYYGDIDRYHRLHRPVMIDRELNCIVRGIYHNTLFAKYWSLQKPTDFRIRRAINARFIMNNELSRITPDTPDIDLPYFIWFPTRANWKTYEELARRKPIMKSQVARACIVADYQNSYDELGVRPDVYLMAEARASPNPHYLRDLERKVAEGDKIEGYTEGWKRYTQQDLFELTATMLSRNVSVKDVGTSFEFVYDGLGADISSIELNVCAPDEMKVAEYTHLDELYQPQSLEPGNED